MVRIKDESIGRKTSRNEQENANRLLITINVVGSVGPLRFVVKRDEPVDANIGKALNAYARLGRLPVLGLNVDDFFLYCTDATSHAVALKPEDLIGSSGGRNFLPCKKQLQVMKLRSDQNVTRPPRKKRSTGGLFQLVSDCIQRVEFQVIELVISISPMALAYDQSSKPRG